MRNLRQLGLSTATVYLLLFCAAPVLAQTPREPTDFERRNAKHFPERPPVLFEIVEDVEHRPLAIITNLHPFPLTAYVVLTEPKSEDDLSRASICDALTRMCGLAPIPRGLSYKVGIPHKVGGPVPGAKLVAAVWEDGSTFGPDDLLARISASRKAMADSYDLAIATLQTGLEKDWNIEEYLAAAQRLQPPMPTRMMATVEEATAAAEKRIAQDLPGRTITINFQHAVEKDRSPASVTRLAQTLLKQFGESRDSLKKALGGQT